MSESSKFAKNYLAMVISLAVNVGLTAATTLVLGWGLTVDEFGVFFYALAIINILSIVAQVGTSQYSISFLPRNRQLTGEFLSAAQGLRLVAIVPTLLIMVLLALFTCKTAIATQVVIVMGLSMVLQLEMFFIRDLFQAVEMNYLGGLLMTIRAATMLLGIFVWYMVFHGPWGTPSHNETRDLLALAIIWAATQVPAVLLAMRMVARRVAPLKINPSPASWWWVLRKSYLFALVSLVTLQAGTLETIILKFFKGDKNDELAYYQVALRLTILALLLAISIGEVFRPIISRKYGESPAAFRRVVHLLHKYMFLTGTPVLIFTAVFANDILALLFGTKFLPAVHLVQIMCLASIFTISPPSWVVFSMTDLQHLSFRIGLLNLVVNVVLCSILLSRYGMYGAACVTAAITLVTKLQTIVYWRRHGYPWVKSITPLLTTLAISSLAAAGCWLLGAYLHLHLIVLGACFCVVFAGAAWVFILDKTDRQAIRDVLHKAVRFRPGKSAAAE